MMPSPFIETRVSDPERAVRVVPRLPLAGGLGAASATGLSGGGRYGGPSWDPSRTCIVLRR